MEVETTEPEPDCVVQPPSPDEFSCPVRLSEKITPLKTCFKKKEEELASSAWGGEGRPSEIRESTILGLTPPPPLSPAQCSQGQVLLEFSSGPVSSPSSHPGSLCAVLPLLPQSTLQTSTFEGYPWNEAQTPGCASHQLNSTPLSEPPKPFCLWASVSSPKSETGTLGSKTLLETLSSQPPLEHPGFVGGFGSLGSLPL